MSRPKVGDLIALGSGGYSLVSNVEDFEVADFGDEFVELTWQDPTDVVLDGTTITSWAGTQIRRKTGNYPINEKDGVLVVDSKVRDQYKTVPYKDSGLTNDVEYYYMAFPYTDKNVFTVDSANRVSATPIFADSSGSPGNTQLIAGDEEAGYFGEVSASELITGDDLALIVGISEGTSQNSTGGWLKFAYKNKVQFVAKKPFRRQISWNSIDSANCVFGDAVIEIGGFSYKVRLFSTASTDPSSSDATNCHYSEWNKLMLPIHIKAKDGSWKYIANVENDLEYWGIDFTDIDLSTGESATGAGSWCQESWTDDRKRAHMRGYQNGDASEANRIVKTSTFNAAAWRPVLELIE